MQLILLIVLFTFDAGFATSNNSSWVRRIRSATGTESGRVVEEFSPLFLKYLSADVRTRLVVQNYTDEISDIYSPQISNGTHENTPLGAFTLGKMISRGPYSILFNIVENPGLLIKYQINCNVDEIHPLLRESWYGSAANAAGVGPSVKFLSPPVRLCPSSEGKCASIVPADEYATCRNTYGTLRYILVEKLAGEDLLNYRKSNFPAGNMGLRNAAVMGAEILLHLEYLHTVARIVHGDIYGPNVMLVPTNGSFTMSLIDFGRAFPVSITPLPTVPVEPGTWFHEYCTQWQIEGYAWAARDDVMKAVQTIIELMHPVSFLRYQGELKNLGYTSLIGWKRHGRMYVSPTHDPVGTLRVTPGVKIRLYERLDSLLMIARALPINGPIPYQSMIEILDQIVEIIDGDALPANHTTVVSVVA